MKEAGISVISANIGKFLDDPEERLLIPRFQRPYSWENDNFEDLWNDVINLESDEVHFIGTIIRYQGKKKKAYYIVDGQQRLTTISILLAAIRDARARLNLSLSVVEDCIKPIDPYTKIGSIRYSMKPEKISSGRTIDQLSMLQIPLAD